MNLRNRTSHLEEIAVDIIHLRDNEDLVPAIKRHGVSHLLLQTRHLLGFDTHREVYNWRSADVEVLKMLQDFPNEFRDSQERKLAEALASFAQEKAKEKEPSEQALVPSEKKYLENLTIQHFRNISAPLTIPWGPRGAWGNDRITTAHILHGPNGTGKSTIYEALQFAVEGVSERQASFLEDKDVRGADSDKYLSDYLLCLDNGKEGPRIKIGGQDSSEFTLKERGIEKLARLEALKDAMMSQDRVKEFCKMREEELGVIVLRGYSDVADEVQRYVQANYDKVHSNRQELLRILGLRANITNRNTAEKRIVEQLWHQRMPSLDQVLLNKLRTLSTVEGLRGAEGIDNLIEFIEEVSASSKCPIRVQEALDKNRWLTSVKSFNTAAERISQVLGSLRKSIADYGADLASEIDLWARWLRKAEMESITASSLKEAREGKMSLDSAAKQQREISIESRFINEHLNHLEKASSFVDRLWQPRHPNICPTCSRQLEEGQTISDSIKKKRTSLEAEIEGLNKRLEGIKKEVLVLEKEVAEVDRCPIPPENQLKISSILQLIAPHSGEIEALLKNDKILNVIKNRLTTLQGPLHFPQPEPDPESLADEAMRLIQSKLNGLRDVWDAPTLWSSVKGKLETEMNKIIHEHLPRTIQAVWREILFAITPALWLIPDRDFVFISAVPKNQIQVGLRIKGRIGRYILNHSEMNIGGLAWFVTRYLLEGRWRYGFMVIDEPAQDMDEVTFRELCRFLYTLSCLHQTMSQRWSLVLFQHDNERASTAANMLHGFLYNLEIDENGAPKLGKALNVTSGIWHIPSLKEAAL